MVSEVNQGHLPKILDGDYYSDFARLSSLEVRLLTSAARLAIAVAAHQVGRSDVIRLST